MPTRNEYLQPIESLLGPLRGSAAPLLTWHGANGERVELSGRVVDNWVAKSANLLQEEYDAGPGTVVRLAAPPHWKTLALALAAWNVGATVTTADVEDADLIITDRPDEVSGEEILAVALPSLALSFDGELPAGALDFAAEVRSFGDVAFAESVSAGTTALVTTEGQLTFAELFAEDAAQGLTAASGAAVFVTDAHAAEADGGLGAVLRAAVVLFAAARPLVVLDAGVEATARLREQERITDEI